MANEAWGTSRFCFEAYIISIYVNDLVNPVDGVNLLLFADDTTIYFSYKRSMPTDGIIPD